MEPDSDKKTGHLNNSFTISSESVNSLKPNWTFPVLANNLRTQVQNRNENFGRDLEKRGNFGVLSSPQAEINLPDNEWARHPFKHSCYRFREVLRKARQRFFTLLFVYPLVTVAVWGLIYSVFGKDEAFPGGNLFSLFVLVKVAIILSNNETIFLAFNSACFALLIFRFCFRQNCTTFEMCTSFWDALCRIAARKCSTLYLRKTFVH